MSSIRNGQVTRARIMCDNLGMDDSDNEGFASAPITPQLSSSPQLAPTPASIYPSTTSVVAVTNNVKRIDTLQALQQPQQTFVVNEEDDDPFEFYRQEIMSLTDQVLTLQTEQMIMQDEFASLKESHTLMFTQQQQQQREQQERKQLHVETETIPTTITPVRTLSEQHPQDSCGCVLTSVTRALDMTIHDVISAAREDSPARRSNLMLQLLGAWYDHAPTTYPFQASSSLINRVLFLWSDALLLQACPQLDAFVTAFQTTDTPVASLSLPFPSDWFQPGHAVLEFLTEQIEVTSVTWSTILQWHGMRLPRVSDSVHDILAHSRIFVRFQCKDGYLFTLEDDAATGNTQSWAAGLPTL